MQVLREKGCRVFILDGRLSAEDAHKLKKLFEETRSQGGPVVVDMSNLEYIDSSGLGALVYILRNSPQGVRLCYVPSKVLDVLELAKLERFFSIYLSREEALGVSERGGR